MALLCFPVTGVLLGRKAVRSGMSKSQAHGYKGEWGHTEILRTQGLFSHNLTTFWLRNLPGTLSPSSYILNDGHSCLKR
jgi:hypothetical protein